ncbi:MAG: response regulator transcription factor [Saprospiraceae bacterium]|nr:response regulator transcription factor [Saprospiraceae bacterium]
MNLTFREKEILYLIAMEKTNQEIANLLFLSPETIRTHRKNILIKLEAINTAGMIRRAFEERLLKIPLHQKVLTFQSGLEVLKGVAR